MISQSHITGGETKQTWKKCPATGSVRAEKSRDKKNSTLVIVM